jgi:hypothetical protein
VRRRMRQDPRHGGRVVVPGALRLRARPVCLAPRPLRRAARARRVVRLAARRIARAGPSEPAPEPGRGRPTRFSEASS